ncbi:hypothetical protein [Labrys wisconsinensis]|uniref:DUF2059 domain-containing protein n=1 Tax=Labrys wisconsinensis TaxID=425677 RepID=A0ABU0J3J0_9HYPH|nr:hypothetical protein [Labrys wisconsinensis]MDQ0468832.1 hypothetical protein [Labrys wisconsinensis]
MRLGVLLCLLAGLAVSTPALAGDDEQVALTPQMVEKFVEGHADLEALAKDLARQYGDRSETEGDDLVAALPAYQDIPEAKARTAALLTKYGFSDLDSWELVTNSVLLAYQYVDPTTAPPNIDEEKTKARAEIEADATLTPDAKKEAEKQLDEQYASLLQYVPLPGNIEAVRPFAARLKPIAEAN